MVMQSYARGGLFLGWDRIDVLHARNVAWFFAEGRVILSSASGQDGAPYCICGVLQRHDGRWLWCLSHSSEPVAAA